MMAIEIEEATHIASEPVIIWGLLIDPTSWKTWWPDCREANSTDFRTLREGSELEVVLQPKHQKLTFTPIVDLITDGKTLSLTHRAAFLQTTVRWYLQEKPEGTRVLVHGIFAGLSPFLMRLLRRDDTLRFSLNSNLRGLKKMAERLV